MYYAATYLCNGPVPKKLEPRTPRHDAKDPPFCGWGRVFFFKFEKSRLLFDPVSFYSANVGHDSAEVHFANGRQCEFDVDWMIANIQKQWRMWARLGYQKDYATAARVLRKLGGEVPIVEVRRQDGEEPKEPVKRGKPMEEDTSKLKPIKAGSKRGKVAKFFHKQPRSLHEAEAQLGMNRNNILSHLHCIRRDHGIGYTLENNSAVLVVPPGFNLFVE